MDLRMKTPCLVLVLLGCATAREDSPLPAEAPKKGESAPDAVSAVASMTSRAPMWADEETCDRAIHVSEATIQTFRSGGPVRMVQDLAGLNDPLFQVDRALSTAELISAVYPDHAVRGARAIKEITRGSKPLPSSS